MRWTKWTAGIAVVGMMGLAACGEQAQEQPATQQQPSTQAPAAQPEAAAGQVPEGATAEQVAQGQQLFTGQGICFTCHGMDATGTQLAPNLTDSEWLWIDPAQGDVLTQVATLIETGVAQPKEAPAPMPPYGGAQLNQEQVQALAAYVVSISGS